METLIQSAVPESGSAGQRCPANPRLKRRIPPESAGSPAAGAEQVRAAASKGGSLINYINAEEILPKNLLDEIRRYFEGGALYVPRSEGRAAWGTGSGTRAELDERNRAIRREYAAGIRMSDLADKYCLSSDSIQKIVHGA